MYKSKKNDYFIDAIHISSLENITQENLQAVISGTDSACPMQFSTALTQHMNRVGCTIDQLAESTYVSASANVKKKLGQVL